MSEDRRRGVGGGVTLGCRDGVCRPLRPRARPGRASTAPVARWRKCGTPSSSALTNSRPAIEGNSCAASAVSEVEMRVPIGTADAAGAVVAAVALDATRPGVGPESTRPEPEGLVMPVGLEAESFCPNHATGPSNRLAKSTSSTDGALVTAAPEAEVTRPDPEAEAGAAEGAPAASARRGHTASQCQSASGVSAN